MRASGVLLSYRAIFASARMWRGDGEAALHHPVGTRDATPRKRDTITRGWQGQ